MMTTIADKTEDYCITEGCKNYLHPCQLQIHHQMYINKYSHFAFTLWDICLEKYYPQSSIFFSNRLKHVGFLQSHSTQPVRTPRQTFKHWLHAALNTARQIWLSWTTTQHSLPVDSTLSLINTLRCRPPCRHRVSCCLCVAVWHGATLLPSGHNHKYTEPKLTED